MRAVRTSDIARLFFRNKRTAQKRLRRLLDGAFTRPIVTDLAAESRWTLTRAGHAVLEEASDDPVAPFRSAPRADARHFAHHDLLVAVWVSVALGARRSDASLLAFRPEWALRSEDPEAPLVPDALILLQKGNGELTLALEADCGTERPPILASKVARYNALTEAGSPLFGARPDAVLFVTSTERRARRIALHLRDRGAIPLIFGAVPHVLVDGGLTTGLATAETLGDENATGNPFVQGLLTGVE